MKQLQISALTRIAIIGIVFSHIHLGVEAQAYCTGTRNGGNATLTCTIPSHIDLDIVQVTWQKRTGNSYDTMVTNSRRFGVKTSKPYENRIIVLPTKDPKTSSITISQLEKEDDTCFTAIFNIYPDGSLKGEVFLQKLSEVREVICKSTADMSITLDPAMIKTQLSDLSGSTIQIGRWLNNAISPVCNFMLLEKARRKRSVQDKDEVFTVECNASGKQKAKITWPDEGRAVSKEEKVNITGDLITVTSTQHHSLATFPEGKTIRCTISYSQDDGSTSAQHSDHESASLHGEELRHEGSLDVTITRIILPSISLLCVVIAAVCYYFLLRKKPYSPKKNDKAEKGLLTPGKHLASNNVGTPGTEIKQRKETEKKRKEKIQKNTQDSGYILAHTDEIKQRSDMKQRKSPSKKIKNSKKELFHDGRAAGPQEGEELDGIGHLR
ncbi:uncharacterized protein LOC130358107 isoform X2 [Hyla sarda]|uniref:uncharacterized protein LOC130358107 isoform X2 n=1 Tax=Hyla sarda TaxID=327740 RepID=UPI0024C31306|nr:uncharacterized protein LOC130358107 isoform X2 [Hyla sarda]